MSVLKYKYDTYLVEHGWRLSGLGPEIREENHQISDNYQKNFRKLNWFSEKMFGRQNPGGDIPP